MKILITDDHALLRDSLSLLLKARFGEELQLLHAKDGRTALDVIQTHPDVALVLLDIDLPDINGLRILDHISAKHSDIRIISISGIATPALMRQCMERGAAGFIPKTSSGKTVLSAIETVLDGGRYIPHEAKAADTAANTLPVLTERQLDVLRLMRQGLSNEEIASAMDIRLPTVKTHVHAILEKLGAKNRTEAVNEALLLRLI